VFVSYSRADKAIVSPVISLLRAAKPTVFWDVDTIQPGDKWKREIRLAIRHCSVFLLFWCSHSDRSHSVKREWRQAISEERRVIPVLLDSTPLPKELREHQWIDLRDLHVPHEPRTVTVAAAASRHYRFEHFNAGRPITIIVERVSKRRWRAYVARKPGVPTALMPFYGTTPPRAAQQLSEWLALAYKRAGSTAASKHSDDVTRSAISAAADRIWSRVRNFKRND
jgi:hypothetical protein